MTEDGTIKLSDFIHNNKGGGNKNINDVDEKKCLDKDSLYWLAPERICKDENIRLWFEK